MNGIWKTDSRDKAMGNIQRPQRTDKEIKRALAEARRDGQGAQRAQGLIVAGSLAVTLAGWAFFSHDSGVVSTAEQDGATAIVAGTQLSTNEESAPIATATPQSTIIVSDTTIAATPTTSSATGSGSNDSASVVVSPQTSAASNPRAVGRTRSSQ